MADCLFLAACNRSIWELKYCSLFEYFHLEVQVTKQEINRLAAIQTSNYEQERIRTGG